MPFQKNKFSPKKQSLPRGYESPDEVVGLLPLEFSNTHLPNWLNWLFRAMQKSVKNHLPIQFFLTKPIDSRYRFLSEIILLLEK
ncbi:hypothetical protein AMR42_07295 [Limnothrix sp. PR1529]|nr:hypothetical protein BCR12_01730 [Limnothrix sp. P13C2]PIB14129.1 hypothetical protein AMR42_07295 [Limnothrix sp. PR1529]